MGDEQTGQQARPEQNNDNNSANDNAQDMQNEIDALATTFSALETAINKFGNAQVLEGLQAYKSVY